MVQEIFVLEVLRGQEKAFEEAFRQATAILSTVKGCLDWELRRCIEQPNKYLVSITWETMDDHVSGFVQSPQFIEVKNLLGPYYLTPPIIEHYEKVV